MPNGTGKVKYHFFFAPDATNPAAILSIASTVFWRAVFTCSGVRLPTQDSAWHHRACTSARSDAFRTYRFHVFLEHDRLCKRDVFLLHRIACKLEFGSAVRLEFEALGLWRFAVHDRASLSWTEMMLAMPVPAGERDRASLDEGVKA